MALFGNRKKEQKKRDKRTQPEDEILDLNLIGEEVEKNKKKQANSAAKRENTGAKRKPDGVHASVRNREFAVVTYFFAFLFLAMIIYIAWFVYFKSESIINNSYNKRSSVYAEHVTRGSILSDDGTVLAETETDDDGEDTRSYPFGEVFAHVVGYTVEGSSGIESSANYYMLRSNTFVLNYLANEITGNKNPGDNVYTTLNVDLQQAAYDALGDYDGAVVVIQPSTGKILAMVSKPSFDPNTLEDDWEEIVEDEDDESVLVNRATQGLYPPGSTFKVFAALEYLRENDYDDSDFSYDCDGSIDVGSLTINCFHNEVHGKVDLEEAFGESCNGAFVKLGLSLDLQSYIDLVNGTLFNSSLPCPLEYNQSSFVLSSDSDDKEVAQTVIGQGETLVTPYHMALLAAAIDNDGVLMTPYLLDYVESTSGTVIKTFETEEYGQLFTYDDAYMLQQYMEYTVSEGTASALSGKSYDAAGKTGSAEYSDTDDSTHAWFIGYASKEGYEDIAIAVVVEDSGAGSKYAVPVAEEVFDTYFSE